MNITDDGLWTGYELNPEGGNCHDVDGPYTLSLEIAETDEYSVSSEDAVITMVVDGDELTYTPAEGEARTWQRIESFVVGDVPVCAG